MSDRELEGRTIVLSGAARGIGRACAELLAGEGALVALLDLQEKELRQVEETILAAGDKAWSMVCDVADRDQVRLACTRLRADHGDADGVVAAAGISRSGPPDRLDQLEDHAWSVVLGVNVMGLVNLARELLPTMRERGHGTIVTFGSTYSFLAAPKFAPYAASKAAIIQITRSIARDYGTSGIRANAICPGWIDTPLLRSDVPGDFDEMMAPIRERSFLGRLGRPSEIAQACLFLTSERSSFLTGASLVVDGGYSVA